MNDVLEKIRAFADEAHGDQGRKYSPERYIAHPLRVMQTCQAYTSVLPVHAAALLHDVLEDTAVSSDQLRDFLLTLMNTNETNETMRLVIELTDVYTKAAYPKLNRKKRKVKEAARLEKISAGAQTIKYADIMDNCRGIAGQDKGFAPVFLRECQSLLDVMTKGNKDLYQKAQQLLKEEREKLSAVD